MGFRALIRVFGFRVRVLTGLGLTGFKGLGFTGFGV